MYNRIIVVVVDDLVLVVVALYIVFKHLLSNYLNVCLSYCAPVCNDTFNQCSIFRFYVLLLNVISSSPVVYIIVHSFPCFLFPVVQSY